MSKTVIMKCTCAHEYQDEKYGPWMRVHNEGAAVKGPPPKKCTVCGSKKA